MKNKAGNIEMLLLLCCLVGVVAFFSLSLAFTSILNDVQEEPPYQADLEKLLEEKVKKEAQLKFLEERLKELDRLKKEKENALSSMGNLPEDRKESMEEELARLKKEHDILKQRIEKLKEEIANLTTPDPLEKRQEKESRETQAAILQEKREELEKQKRGKEEALSSIERIPDDQRKRSAENLDKLKQEYDLLLQRIQDLRKELAGLPQSDPQGRQAKERELEALKKQLEEMRKQIDEKTGILARFGESSQSDSLEGKQKSLTRELEELRKRKEGLEKSVSILKTRALIGGTSRFKNPLFVECRKDAYIFYPNGEAAKVAELENGNIFKERSAGHDIVVLFVRPDGIDSFSKAYPKVKAISTELCYEPVESDQTLDFLKE